MSKHTPGPWIFEDEIVAHFYRIYDSRFRLIATVPAGSKTKPSLAAAPNMRLIAAAPDLYSALKEWEDYNRECHALDLTRKAIAKAEGRQ